MKRKRNLILMEMVNAGNVNGVTRCVETIIDGFSHDNSFNVIYLKFVYGKDITNEKEKEGSFSLIYVTLPQDMHSFFVDSECRKDLWNRTFYIIRQYLKNTPILHVHTLNLCEFAIFVKEKIPCKIITHLHCIPWKGLYNIDIQLFNKLYEDFYINREKANPTNFIKDNHEKIAYIQSDCLICVTECAREFVTWSCPQHTKNIRVVTNGIYESPLIKKNVNKKTEIECVFVGNSQQSKGLFFVLEAMQAILTRIPSKLTVVGNIPHTLCDKIKYMYPFLNIRFTGVLSYRRLREIYSQADIGIISSIQEQCSYVAIEMMMAGLPIIATDVDGLSELISDGYNGIKVPVSYSPTSGLHPDIVSMSKAIIRLGLNPNLRKRLGENAQRRFQREYTQKQMISKLKKIYTSLCP